MPLGPQEPRFLTVPDVAEILNTSVKQIRALLARGEIRGIQIGGRGQWRIERVELEAYIQRQYERSDPVRPDPDRDKEDQKTD